MIGGFVPGAHGLDSVIVGYYPGEALMYLARGRYGPSALLGVRCLKKAPNPRDFVRQSRTEASLALGRRIDRSGYEQVHLDAAATCRKRNRIICAIQNSLACARIKTREAFVKDGTGDAG